MTAAYGPIHSFHAWEPPAPVKRAGLSPAQCRALVTIFFAGEMNRARQFFIADGCETVYGTTVDILHRKGLVKLGESSVEGSPHLLLAASCGLPARSVTACASSRGAVPGPLPSF